MDFIFILTEEVNAKGQNVGVIIAIILYRLNRFITIVNKINEVYRSHNKYIVFDFSKRKVWVFFSFCS